MSEISEFTIGTKHGPRPLLEWIEQHKHRNFALFSETKQLEVAKEIAGVEDQGAREIMLNLLCNATSLQDYLVEAHREMDTIHGVLRKIDDRIDQATAAAAGKEG